MGEVAFNPASHLVFVAMEYCGNFADDSAFGGQQDHPRSFGDPANRSTGETFQGISLLSRQWVYLQW